MKFSKKTSMLLVGIVAALAFVASAAASYNFDPTCSLTPSNGTGACGFVGKGDVQTALGYNNGQMQSHAGSLVFTYSAAGTQALSESASQSATQTTSEVITCQDGNGVSQSYKTDTSFGTRTGSRSGSRTGTQTGTVGYTIAYDSRIHNQIDGFFLTTPVTATGFVSDGTDPSWDAVVWNGDGSYSWGAPVESTTYVPSSAAFAACEANGTQLSDVTTVGDIVEGAVQYGSPVLGDFTPSGSAALYVSGYLVN